MSTVDLWLEFISARANPRTAEVLDLLAVQDVDIRAHCGLAHAVIEDWTYQPHPLGPLSVIGPVVDHGELVDLFAFPVLGPKVWGTRLAAVPLLGSSAIDGQLLGKPLRIFRHPLEWLRSGLDGIVIRDPNRIPADILSAPNGIIPEDVDHGRELERRFTSLVRGRLPNILVIPEAEAAE